MIQAMLTAGDFCHALALLLFQTAMALAGIAVMVAIWLGTLAAFKNWRLYSPHPHAKRIRTWLRNRRQAKAARS